MATVIREWVCEANVGKASSADQARNNIAKLKKAFQPNDTDPGGGTPLYFLNEIDEGGDSDHGNEHQMLKDQWPNYHWGGFSEMVPIGAGGEWEVMSTKITKTHGGLSGVTPARPIVETRVRRKSDHWCELILMCSHAVAGAWTHPGQSHEQQRRDMWNTWFRILKDRVSARLQAGETVIFAGDTNRPDMPTVHANEKRWVSGGSSKLDYVMGWNGRQVHFKHVKNRTIDLTIDGHNAHAALLELHKAS